MARAVMQGMRVTLVHLEPSWLGRPRCIQQTLPVVQMSARKDHHGP